MAEFKYAKSYSKAQFDGTGTRFRTDGDKFQMEVFYPLTVKDADPVELASLIKEKSDTVVDPTTNIVNLVHADAPDETYLVVSGWVEPLTAFDRSLPTILTFH